MLRIICLLLVFFGACTMSASILIYKKTIKTYMGNLPLGKSYGFNRHTFIMVLMLFFLIGYIATIFFIFNLVSIDSSMFLIAIIFFFGAVFCYSVVFVQSELLKQLDKKADELRIAFEESKTANASLEILNHDLVNTMEALKNAQSQLIFSEKMSTLGELIAGVSHEINTPICAVNASAVNLQSAFTERFDQIFYNIRQITDEDFKHFKHYTNLAISNNNQFTSTAEIRALKRKARQTLSEAEGFNETVLDLLSRNCLLDNETVLGVIPLLSSETFVPMLRLVTETVSIITSIDTALVSSDKVIKMVKSLKSFSHFNVDNEKTTFNIVKGIETVLSIYTNQLKYDIEVVTDYQSSPEIEGYQDELSQVWSNLIQNAIHAMSDNANSQIEEHRHSKLVITVKNIDNKHVAISIADNGKGINQDKIKRIFEPFYTTKPTGIGTGLGLSISKQIIDKHNGTIDIDSIEGSGTTFTVTLPL